MVGAPTGNLNGLRWTDEHDAFLRVQLAEGMSMAQAAMALNLEFHTSYTRNACIGRAMRKQMERNRAMGPVKRKAPKIVPPAKPRWRKPVDSPPPPEPFVLRCVEIEPRHLTLIDLQADDCRWPYGDGPFTFCGHPAVFGSYCGPHDALSRGLGTSSERAANRISRKVA